MLLPSVEGTQSTGETGLSPRGQEFFEANLAAGFSRDEALDAARGAQRSADALDQANEAFPPENKFNISVLLPSEEGAIESPTNVTLTTPEGDVFVVDIADLPPLQEGAANLLFAQDGLLTGDTRTGSPAGSAGEGIFLVPQSLEEIAAVASTLESPVSEAGSAAFRAAKNLGATDDEAEKARADAEQAVLEDALRLQAVNLAQDRGFSPEDQQRAGQRAVEQLREGSSFEGALGSLVETRFAVQIAGSGPDPGTVQQLIEWVEADSLLPPDDGISIGDFSPGTLSTLPGFDAPSGTISDISPASDQPATTTPAQIADSLSFQNVGAFSSFFGGLFGSLSRSDDGDTIVIGSRDNLSDSPGIGTRSLEIKGPPIKSVGSFLESDPFSNQIFISAPSNTGGQVLFPFNPNQGVQTSAGTNNDDGSSSSSGDSSSGSGSSGDSSSGSTTTTTSSSTATISIADVTVSDASSTNAVFTVTLSTAIASDSTFSFSTTSLTAGTSDFTATSGTGTIAAGSTSTTLSVPVASDSLLEPQEQFSVTLSNLSSNVTASDATAVGKISSAFSDSEPLIPFTNGVVITISGATSNGNLGASFAAADFNLDGFVDLLFGEPVRFNEGGAVLINGSASPADVTLPASGTTVFTDSKNEDQETGTSVVVGNFNGTGPPDLAAGSPNRNDTAFDEGGVQLETSFTIGTTVDLNSPDVALVGDDSSEKVGQALAVGDFNGNGFDDIFAGTKAADPSSGSDAGRLYAVFEPGNASSPFALSGVNGTTGFKLEGRDAGDNLGASVALADVDGDGIADLLVGATGGDPNGNSFAGEVFGIKGGQSLSATVDVNNVGGSVAGIILNEAAASDIAGTAIASAGDVTGDRIADALIGAPQAGTQDAGIIYVVNGGTSFFNNASLELDSLDGTNGGGKILGNVAFGNLGGSVGSGGDVNADGIDDIVAGGSSLNSSFGTVLKPALIFGRLGGIFDSDFDLANLTADRGRLLGEIPSSDSQGGVVDIVGDINGDGFDDIVVSQQRADTTQTDAGKAYIFLGGDFTGIVTNQGTANADTLTGTTGNDIMVGGLGNDTLVGNGGVDALSDGNGDDILAISDTTFRRVDGGGEASGGIGDTLRLDGSNVALDLTAIGDLKIQGIERLDITGSGNNTVTLDLSDVLNISETSNTLTIFGDAGDTANLKLTDNSPTTSTVTNTDGTFTQYTISGVNMTLLVDQDITQVLSST